MASRKALKEQRRRERLEEERRLAREEARRRRLRIGGVAAAAVLATAGLVALQPWEQSPPDPFSFSPEGVRERLERAGLDEDPTAPHIHPKVAVTVRAKPVPVPAGMGLGAQHVPLHTHESDGTIHVEGAGDPTLAQFMALWGVRLTPRQLGPYAASKGERVRMWVQRPGGNRFDEVPVRADLPLEDQQQIQLAFGTDAQAPIR
jgi:hypothetical protein